MNSFKVAYLTLVLIAVNSPVFSQSPAVLSDEAEVIIMSFSPGQEELYSAFGHSAIRVSDPSQKIDIVFNYGIFDFDQPNFYLNFAKGKLLYKLGTGPYDRYKAYYSRINRTITEQTLNIDSLAKQNVYDYMINNAKPENADYYYNYCYDNCATKIRDVINIALQGQVTFDYQYADDSLSYRGLMDKYMDQQPWGDFGIDFCLGMEIDRVADAPAYMYMPEYLELAIDKATIKTDSTDQPLVKKKQIVNTAVDKPSMASAIKPVHVFVALFFIIGILTSRSFKFQVDYKFIDILLFGITGFFGIGLLFLWLGTDHLSQGNFNIIWANPLNVIILFFLFNKKNSVWVRYYFIANSIILGLLIVFNGLMPQQLHPAFIPIVLSLIVRSIYLMMRLKA
ncbi:MAG: DUF4105 domain-containing protein [Reichenbachiella sp.]